MVGVIAGAVILATGVIIGAALVEDSSDDNYIIENQENERNEIEKLNREIEEMSKNNEKFMEALKRREETEKKFREEMIRREKERQKEIKRVEEQLEKNIKEQQRIRERIKEMRKKKDIRTKEEENRLRKKLNQLKKEKELKEKEKKEKERKRELSEEQWEMAKREIIEYKKIIKELINKGDLQTIQDEIDNIEKAIYIIKDFYAQGNISREVFFPLIEVVINIYEDLGDIFYEQGLPQQAVNMYEMTINIDVNAKYSNKFMFKYARALYKIGRYNDALQYLNKFDLNVINNKNEKNKLKYELDNLYFKIYLSLENTLKIDEYAYKMIDEYINDKIKVNELLKVLEKYIEYSHSKEQMVTYLSLLSKYKAHKNLIEILDNEIYDDFEYKDFYIGLQLYQENKLDEATNKFLKYAEKGNSFAKIYYLDSKRLTNKLTKKDGEEIDRLLNEISKMLHGKNINLRKKYYEENHKLVYLDYTNTEHYFRMYLTLMMAKLKYLFNKQEYDKFFNLVKNVNKEYFVEKGFNVSNKFKRDLANYYSFFKKHAVKEKANIIYQVLEENFTKIELENYLNDSEDFNKRIEDVYDISDKLVPFIESPFYRAYYVENKISRQKQIMLETYNENLNIDKVERRESAINKDIILGKKYDNFANIYQYSIEDGVTRIVYPYFKNNLKNYMLENNEFNTDTFDVKKKYALDLIDIFMNLDKEGIVISSLNPEKLMIDDKDNIILRDTFFGSTFRSESTTSAGSIRTFKENKYKVPDERKERDFKSNYYLLGLILYELLYGEYIFAGVKDFETIKFLHDERRVKKENVVTLKERWINIKNNLYVRVEKIKPGYGNIPDDIHKLLKQMLSADKRRRPDNLRELKAVFKNLKIDDLKIDISKPISKKDLINFIASLKNPSIKTKDKKLIKIINQNIDKIKLDNYFEGNYYLMVSDINNKSYGINKIGTRYKVEEINDTSINNFDSKKTKASKDYNIKKLIKDTERLMDIKEQFADYLYQTRQFLYDIDKGNNFYKNIDDYYLKETDKIIAKLNIDKKLYDLVEELRERSISADKYLQFCHIVIEKLSER